MPELLRLQFKASMGPRFDERGNRACSAWPKRTAWLQWGRASMSAEIPPRHSFGRTGVASHFARGDGLPGLVSRQSAGSGLCNSLIAKELAGWPGVANHAAARRSKRHGFHHSLLARSSPSLYTTSTRDLTLKTLPRHSMPPSRGLWAGPRSTISTWSSAWWMICVRSI